MIEQTGAILHLVFHPHKQAAGYWVLVDVYSILCYCRDRFRALSSLLRSRIAGLETSCSIANTTIKGRTNPYRLDSVDLDRLSYLSYRECCNVVL